MEDHELLFQRYLEQRGWKLTNPRKKILQTVFALHEHFDAEQLHARLRDVYRNISLATVYRTLPLLVEAGLIQLSLRFSARDVYEHIYGHPRHVHWVCRNCGTVQETSLKQVQADLNKEAERLKFQTEETSIQVKGLCWKCQSIENDNH